MANLIVSIFSVLMSCISITLMIMAKNRMAKSNDDFSFSLDAQMFVMQVLRTIDNNNDLTWFTRLDGLVTMMTFQVNPVPLKTELQILHEFRLYVTHFKNPMFVEEVIKHANRYENLIRERHSFFFLRKAYIKWNNERLYFKNLKNRLC